MIDTIDNFLNNITMYRLVLYYLIGLLVVAAVYSLFGVLPFSFLSLAFSSLFLVLVCWFTNQVFAKTFGVSPNVESLYITALILALIITPARSVHDVGLLFWAGVLAMASKYIFTFKRKHFLNPAAIAVFLTALFLGQSASWWIGNLPMAGPVLFGGFLILRKIKKSDMAWAFAVTTLLTVLFLSFSNGPDLITLLSRTFVHTSLLFFAFVMLTEPLTTPPRSNLQIFYGILVGFLFAPQVHLGSFYTTPESALLIGNIFSFLVSPKERLVLTLSEKIQLAPDIYDFVFIPDAKTAYSPGEYMEWTLGHDDPDDRGNRRYFTLASSPTEEQIRIGVKFYLNSSSSFKKKMLSLSSGDQISASSLAGDFVLPKDQNQKLVFIAGGIGITPYRSMLKYLMDAGEKRSIVLFYSNKYAQDVVYRDVFDQASSILGTKVIYTLTETDQIPLTWTGLTGRINEKMIREEVPDFSVRKFYLSGPHTMVENFERELLSMGIPRSQIKTDYFPGFV